MSQPVLDDEPKLPSVSAEAEDAAREQLAEYFGFARHAYITAGGEQFEITNQNLLSEEQQERYDEVQAELRTLDHETVVIRNAITNEVVVDPKTGEPLTDRVLIEPHTKDGVLVKPTYWSRVLRAIIGDDAHERFIAKGGRSSEFRLVWSRMTREMLERAAEDSKSKDSSRDMAKVANRNRG
jgi:hypothetical protein